MYAQERTKPQGQKVGKGVAPWRPWWVRHCRSRIIQASTWTASCKYHWEYFVRGGLIRTTTFKQQDNNAVGRSTLPELWETLTHQSHRVHKQRKKESKTIGPRVQLPSLSILLIRKLQTLIRHNSQACVVTEICPASHTPNMCVNPDLIPPPLQLQNLKLKSSVKKFKLHENANSPGVQYVEGGRRGRANCSFHDSHCPRAGGITSR